MSKLRVDASFFSSSTDQEWTISVRELRLLRIGSETRNCLKRFTNQLIDYFIASNVCGHFMGIDIKIDYLDNINAKANLLRSLNGRMKMKMRRWIRITSNPIEFHLLIFQEFYKPINTISSFSLYLVHNLRIFFSPHSNTYFRIVAECVKMCFVHFTFDFFRNILFVCCWLPINFIASLWNARHVQLRVFVTKAYTCA